MNISIPSYRTSMNIQVFCEYLSTLNSIMSINTARDSPVGKMQPGLLKSMTIDETLVHILGFHNIKICHMFLLVIW